MSLKASRHAGDSLAHQALDAVKEIADTWLDFKARMIDHALVQRRQDRKRAMGDHGAA
jgi:hypothetical protein